MAVKQISVFVENRAGSLLEITTQLANAGINIRAVTMADTTRFGIFRMIVDQPAACEALLRDDGFTVSITNVLVVGLQDEPGGLSGAIRLLAEAGINIDYLYAFISHAVHDACVILRVADIEIAEKILREAGIRLFSEEEIMHI